MSNGPPSFHVLEYRTAVEAWRAWGNRGDGPGAPKLPDQPLSVLLFYALAALRWRVEPLSGDPVIDILRTVSARLDGWRYDADNSVDDVIALSPGQLIEVFTHVEVAMELHRRAMGGAA